MGAPVSLVMTDIVASTRLWAQFEPEMADDLTAHDRAVREIVARRGGSVFKHTGDGAIAAFADPSAALLAAAEIQQAMGALAWRTPDGLRVRVAVNTGAVVERDGDLFGTPVNRVARLVGLCPPGAVLVANSTMGLVTESSLAPLELRLVGRVALKGLEKPETVHALVGPGLVAVARLAGDLGTASPLGSLPRADLPLVGRGEESKAACAAVLADPIVSIVGVAGMGKTRLALEVATGLAAEFADGAWWCDLSVATSADAVAPVVLDALAARQAAGRSPMESICDGLMGRHALVVLDNCEHVLEIVREVAIAIRAACPTVRVLATGREALGVRGEHVIPLSSLPVDDAVTLFVDRVLDARPDIDLGGDALAAAQEVCVRLDGIPLAVELAAARCRSMSPVEVNERLTDRFRLLRSGRPSVERHRTLQAAVAWSYDLLSNAERDVFEQLAVFADGCLVDGVAAVAGLDEYDALDVLDGLVARSMVMPVATPLGTRYRQLETLRQYAEDRLIEHGTITDVRDRHVRWMHDLAGSIRATEGTASAGAAFRRYCAEVDNMRVAVAHATASGQRDTAEEIMADTWRCAYFRPTLEARWWFDPTQRTQAWTVAAAEVAGLQACLAYVEGDIERIPQVLAAIPAEFDHLMAVAEARCLYELYCRGDVDAAEQALNRCRPRSDSDAQLVAAGRVMCSWPRLQEPDCPAEVIETTRLGATENLARVRRLGDEADIACSLTSVAFTHVYSDTFEIACAAASECVALSESLGAGFLTDAARLALGLGLARMAATGSFEASQVATTIRQSIELARERNDRPVAVNMLHAVAQLVAASDPETAYFLMLVYRRAPGALIPVEPPDEINAGRRAEVEAAAAVIPFDDAVALALAILDRHYPA
jgi:predicted ATPase/class 3 adenylate cyclase